jgi:hypothetical protein
MKTNITKTWILIALMSLIFGASAYAYPPDNAAVLYYQACLNYHPYEAKDTDINDYLNGTIELNDDIIAHVQSNRYVIKLVTDASELGFCDWGLDMYGPDWLDLQLPHLSTLRGITRLMIADAKIAAARGDVGVAFDRCLTLHRVAHHVDSHDNLICCLVGICISRIANETIQQLLPVANQDRLNYLKTELAGLEPFSVTQNIQFEFGLFSAQMTKERTEKIVNQWNSYFDSTSGTPLKDLLLDRIAHADDQFYERNRRYCQNIMAAVLESFNLPYSQAYEAMHSNYEKTHLEVVDNPDATLTMMFLPEYPNTLSFGTTTNTFTNAIRVAVEVYLIKAKTGALPDVLPSGLPGDLFSGQDFEYAKTSDAFTLRCRSKDLSKDKIYEYSFKLK